MISLQDNPGMEVLFRVNQIKPVISRKKDDAGFTGNVNFPAFHTGKIGAQIHSGKGCQKEENETTPRSQHSGNPSKKCLSGTIRGKSVFAIPRNLIFSFFQNLESVFPPASEIMEDGKRSLTRCRGLSPAAEFEGAKPSCSFLPRRRLQPQKDEL